MLNLVSDRSERNFYLSPIVLIVLNMNIKYEYLSIEIWICINMRNLLIIKYSHILNSINEVFKGLTNVSLPGIVGK